MGIGGTAVGSGLNAHPQYRSLMVRRLGELTGLPVAERDVPSVAACLAAAACGADFLRIHEVKLLKPALLVYEAIRGRAG